MTDIDDLRRLLVGDSLREIEDDVNQVRHRLDDDQVRANDVARVLPSAVANADEDLSDALERPVAAAVRRSIHKNPDDFADILFPIMGPAIRSSIAEAIRAMMTSINDTVEATLTMRGLKWRFQAMRAGVPYAEVALQNTFVYRVEQIFLINRNDSLLIGHVAAPDVVERDNDAVSAMFSAIQDFVRDSFSSNDSDALREIEVGGHTVWSVHGPYAMLVAVVRGSPPTALRQRLLGSLESMHAKYGGSLRAFNGETNSIPGLESRLEECLELEFRHKGNQSSDAESKSGQDNQQKADASYKSKVMSWLTPRRLATRVLPCVIALGLMIGWSIRAANFAERYELAVAIVKETPGFSVTDSKHDGDDITLIGMRDPLATLDSERLSEAGVDAESITLNMQPYLSLDPAIVERRAARMLSLPASVKTELDVNKVLHLSGVISDQHAARINKIRGDGFMLPGVSDIDISSLRLSRGKTPQSGVAGTRDASQAGLTQ